MRCDRFVRYIILVMINYFIFGLVCKVKHIYTTKIVKNTTKAENMHTIFTARFGNS